MRSYESKGHKEEGGATMKFYIAGYSGLQPDDMDYKKLGGVEELYGLFPELKKVLNRLICTPGLSSPVWLSISITNG